MRMYVCVCVCSKGFDVRDCVLDSKIVVLLQLWDERNILVTIAALPPEDTRIG